MVDAMTRELQSRVTEVEGESIQSIYFGGGTPSLVPPDDIARIVELIHDLLPVTGDPEITLEANPEDLTDEFLRKLKRTGVNRLSIGVQSFHDDELKSLNRNHSASQSEAGVKRAQDNGLDHLTIDLMYALPGTTSSKWLRTVEAALALNVPHISAYCLTIEPKTTFGRWTHSGKMQALPDDIMETQYLMLCELLAEAGYGHYELSNFARKGMESRHNSNYWRGDQYMGIGPSAHSFSNGIRRWNISNNRIYIKAIREGTSFWEKEELTETDRYNEYLITRIRTAQGVAKQWIAERRESGFWDSKEERIQQWNSLGWLSPSEEYFALSERGMLMADTITTELMMEK